mmetsp:Transcript_15348/g.19931  ORF Transcript_15348/g.19931 Transcript_15348/m.19931 type:complete len:319 (+) Transcript_15348:81-1037(+)
MTQLNNLDGTLRNENDFDVVANSKALLTMFKEHEQLANTLIQQPRAKTDVMFSSNLNQAVDAIRLFGCVDLPDPPMNLHAVAQKESSQILLQWTPVLFSHPITGYTVEMVLTDSPSNQPHTNGAEEPSTFGIQSQIINESPLFGKNPFGGKPSVPTQNVARDAGGFSFANKSPTATSFSFGDQSPTKSFSFGKPSTANSVSFGNKPSTTNSFTFGNNSPTTNSFSFGDNKSHVINARNEEENGSSARTQLLVEKGSTLIIPFSQLKPCSLYSFRVRTNTSLNSSEWSQEYLYTTDSVILTRNLDQSGGITIKQLERCR